MLDLEAGVHDEYQDVHKDLYWFGLAKCNTICPVWGYVSFIELGGLKYGTRNGGNNTCM